MTVNVHQDKSNKDCQRAQKKKRHHNRNSISRLRRVRLLVLHLIAHQKHGDGCYDRYGDRAHKKRCHILIPPRILIVKGLRVRNK